MERSISTWICHNREKKKHKLWLHQATIPFTNKKFFIQELAFDRSFCMAAMNML